MKIAIGNDHRGLDTKKQIMEYFKDIEFINVGTDSYESADHPIYAFKVGEMVASKQADLGILICGTGIGMSIACNKVKNIRCAKVSNASESVLARQHNDANVLALSSKTDKHEVIEIVKSFLTTKTLEDNKYVKLKRLDEKMIIGGMSKYNEPSMTLQRDLFNAQTIKYVCIPFEMDTYQKYLESIAMCNLSLNGYSQNLLNALEELRKMVYPLVAGGNVNKSNTQNNTEEKRGLFGGKKYKTQQNTQFSNNINDTLNKMRTNNF